MKRYTWLLVLISILAISTLTTSASAYPDHTRKALSQATSQGSIIVIWGDPFTEMTVSSGVGGQSVRLTGKVSPRPDLPGYFIYDSMKLYGKTWAEWTNGNDRYVLRAEFSMITNEPPMMPATVAPGADSFVIMEMNFDATLRVNGQTRQAKGMAALVALAPGYFAFYGSARATIILLYDSPLGFQVVLRWSMTEQMLDGMQHPAADRFRQKVAMSGPR